MKQKQENHSPFAVVFIHYNLNGGGVTRIIEQQSLALSELGVPHLIFCGEKTIQVDLPHRIIPQLQFTNFYQAEITREIIDTIEREIRTAFSCPLVFHFHNHSIGLNPYMEDIVSHLVQSYRCVLQIHDFIEDGRAKNLTNIRDIKKLYPQGNHIAYCGINSRDTAILQRSGTPSTLLPNSYREIPRHDVEPGPLIFYPVQALRRKNLGEILLLALATPPPYQYAIGQTPNDASDHVDFWIKVAKALNLPIRFDVCEKIPPVEKSDSSFVSWYAHSSHIVTTSIQEGFGMTFLEPLYFDRPLFGRDLPDITTDIKSKGILHSHLYTKIKIESTKFQFDDFGNLAESMQKQVLEFLADHPEDLMNVFVLHNETWVDILSFVQSALSTEKALSQHLLHPWSMESLKDNLLSLYQGLMDKEIGLLSVINYNTIAKSFDSMPRHALKHHPFDPSRC